jgi:hypothetical protein
MPNDWQDLTRMIESKDLLVKKVSAKTGNISIEGEFELPPLAKLSYEDQVFVAMFIKVHGSIKEMEQAFGVSYPTIKARLNKIGELLGFVEGRKISQKDEILSKLDNGEISVSEALERLSQ